MGEIAEMILDGILDSQTGEYLGPGVGYPRSRYGQSWQPRNENPYNVICLFLKTRNIVLAESINDVLKAYSEKTGVIKKLHTYIRSTKQTWKAFKKWVDETYPVNK